jgi:SPP1 gp7 family putative phage head morphogenesis protein
MLFDQFGRPLPSSKPRPETRALYTPTKRDQYNTYPRRGLTAGRLAQIMREADAGYPARQAELFGEIEESDAHVRSQLGIRRQAILGLEYDVYTDDDDSQAQKITEFCRGVVFSLGFDELLADLVEAIPQGWAMTELVWDSSSGQAIITGHESIPQERTRWDDHMVPMLATDAEYRGVSIPPFKVVYHTMRARKRMVMRAGLMRTCSWWWLFKNFSVKDWAIFCEVYGMPLRIGKYEPGASPEDIDKLKEALYSLGTDGAAVISSGTEIELRGLEKKGSGTSPHEQFARYCDSAISKAVLGQTLTSEVGTVGSYAAAKVHDEVRQDVRDADAARLAETVREQLLRPLVLFNYGPDAPVPWFRFAIEEPEDLGKKSEVYERLSRMGVPIPMGHIQETFGIPAPEGGEEVLGGPPLAMQANRGGYVQDMPMLLEPATTRWPVAAFRPAINSAVNRQVAQAQESLDRVADKSLTRVPALAGDMARPLMQQLDRAQSYDQALAAILPTFMDMDPTDLADELMRAVIAAEINGRLAAAQTGPGAAINSMRLAVNAAAELLFEPVDPERAFQFWSGQAVVTREQFDRLADSAKARAFTMAGVAREDMLAELYGGIDSALREGTTFNDFKNQAADIFERRGLAGPNPWHLENVFRTNIQSAYMAGRYSQMAEAAGERPYWQYHAVIDRQTRPSHAAQNGKVYHSGHPFWSTWYPPNGFACRCDVVSLSESEVQGLGLKPQKSMPADKPDAGWSYSVGEAGWGRGQVESVFGAMLKRGAWRPRADLLSESDAAPMPAAGPMPDLPGNVDDLRRELGSTDAVREHYRQSAITRNEFPIGSDGRPLDLPLIDARGDNAVLAARAVDYGVSKDDIARARYLGLAREVIEQADEVWLVPGAYDDGAIRLRRYYLKVYGDGPGAVAVFADTERAVWNGFNMLPVREREVNKRRVGLLIHPLKT